MITHELDELLSDKNLILWKRNKPLLQLQINLLPYHKLYDIILIVFQS